ncbi:hypothetical protein KIN20_023774 [Parelaphostrongylus tenuis]|uniref:Uncharacterized protein n=1 Tax=Parelaphostrongylus tenuis TaxID=148309 RepID=A0AAD5MSI1_PARTN|nr:hypothetical protein KIN20_023774 [Parelaphostrongylus tenuis]
MKGNFSNRMTMRDRQHFTRQRKWSTTLESKWYRRGSRTLGRNGPSDEGSAQLPPTSTVSLIGGYHPYGRLTSPGPPHLSTLSIHHCSLYVVFKAVYKDIPNENLRSSGAPSRKVRVKRQQRLRSATRRNDCGQST